MADRRADALPRERSKEIRYDIDETLFAGAMTDRMPIHLRQILMAVVLGALWCTGAHGAEFKVKWLNPEHTGASLTIKGNLVLEDLSSFRAIARELAHAREVGVELDSPGGLVAAAIEIGTTIHAYGWITAVFNKATCASACAFIWLAGKMRFYEGTVHIGFHGSREPGSWERSARGDALITSYLKPIEVPDNIIAFALAAPPTGMSWLSEATVKSLALKAINKDEWDRMWIAIGNWLRELEEQRECRTC